MDVRCVRCVDWITFSLCVVRVVRRRQRFLFRFVAVVVSGGGLLGLLRRVGLPLLRLVAGDDRRQRRGAPQLRPRVARRERRAVGGGGLWRREDEVEGALLLQHAEAGRAAPPETCLRRRLELLKSDGIVMQENVHLYERT